MVERQGRAARTTRVAAVIGDPVRHSRSPAIHNAAFAATGIDWVFGAFEAPAGTGAAALKAMRALRLAGLSVTMPLKAELAEAADVRDEMVAVLGAANCILPLGDGRLRAANTDADGFVSGLRADAGVEPEGLRVALVGAGGAARAVAWGLAAAGAAEVAVVNRTLSKARTAADVANAAAGSGRPGRVGSTDDIAAADVVVNATAVGMGAGRPTVPRPTDAAGGEAVADAGMGADPCALNPVLEVGSGVGVADAGMGADPCALNPVLEVGSGVGVADAGMGADPRAAPGRSAMPCDPGLMRPGQVAVDLVYEPLETPWLAALRHRGVEAHNGLSMLVYQAAAAFELWTGVEAPVEVMRSAASADRHRRPL